VNCTYLEKQNQCKRQHLKSTINWQYLCIAGYDSAKNSASPEATKTSQTKFTYLRNSQHSSAGAAKEQTHAPDQLGSPGLAHERAQTINVSPSSGSQSEIKLLEIERLTADLLAANLERNQ